MAGGRVGHWFPHLDLACQELQLSPPLRGRVRAAGERVGHWLPHLDLARQEFHLSPPFKGEGPRSGGEGQSS